MRNMGGEGRQFVGGEIVELDEHHLGTVRPDDQAEPFGDRRVEQGRDGAAEIGVADAVDVNRIEPVFVVGVGLRSSERFQRRAQSAWPPRFMVALDPRDVKARGAHTGEQIQHGAGRRGPVIDDLRARIRDRGSIAFVVRCGIGIPRRRLDARCR